MRASADKQRYTHTFTICYIAVFNICVIHFLSSPLYRWSTRALISLVCPTFQKFSPRYPQVLLVTFILSWSLFPAVWTFPLKIIINNNLAVISAHMTIIRFCIKFSILNMLINIFNNFFQCRQVVLHIWHLYI